MQALSLSNSGCLPFKPSGKKTWLQDTFKGTPRYLFRMTTPKSDGSTDEIWAKSKDASHGCTNHDLDIFSMGDDKQVASMLNRHLRWKGSQNDPDNLVS